MTEYHIMLGLLVMSNLYLVAKVSYIDRVIDVALTTKHEAPVWLSREARKQAILDYDFLRNSK